jgi:soluble lytic murein transglycosylase-like protein
MQNISRRHFALLATAALAACSTTDAIGNQPARAQQMLPVLYPNETRQLRDSINRWSDHHEIPPSLVHRLAIRESTHNPAARNGPYYGLLQILPGTARTMGFRGQPPELLNADTNLKYAGKYLRGAWLLSDSDEATAIGWYARGYYYEAKRRGMLIETGLKSG